MLSKSIFHKNLIIEFLLLQLKNPKKTGIHTKERERLNKKLEFINLIIQHNLLSFKKYGHRYEYNMNTVTQTILKNYNIKWLVRHRCDINITRIRHFK